MVCPLRSLPLSNVQMKFTLLIFLQIMNAPLCSILYYRHGYCENSRKCNNTNTGIYNAGGIVFRVDCCSGINSLIKQILLSSMISRANACLIFVDQDCSPKASVYLSLSTLSLHIRNGRANMTFVISITDRASLYLSVL